jgi:hypothetical protein
MYLHGKVCTRFVEVNVVKLTPVFRKKFPFPVIDMSESFSRSASLAHDVP